MRIALGCKRNFRSTGNLAKDKMPASNAKQIFKTKGGNRWLPY